MLSYKLTHQAEQDLREIWTYIAQDNPTAADKVLGNLYHSFSQLGQFPKSGKRQGDFTSSNLRFLTSHNYFIAYRPETQPTEIFRILSSYRDITSLLTE